jgi:hypothetical protein
LTTGAEPEPADRGWTVLRKGPLRVWLEGEPPLADIGAVTEWLRACELLGPPAEALLVDDGDLCTVTTEANTVEIQFLVIAYERLIVVRSIRSGS